jgi:hypothetical protein
MGIPQIQLHEPRNEVILQVAFAANGSSNRPASSDMDRLRAGNARDLQGELQ